MKGCERELCALAALCTAEEFRDACNEWEAAADPTEHLHEYIKAQARRHLVRGKDLFGNVHFSGALDPVNGEMFLNAIDGRSDALYRQDQADGTERTGSQRAADALMDLVLDGVAAPPGSKPHEIVAQLAQNARIQTVQVGPDGSVLDDTRGGRHFTPHQKRLIRLRDRCCAVPGCNTKAKYCEYDHVQPHERDGPTTVANGQLLCRFHHRWKHRASPVQPIQLE